MTNQRTIPERPAPAPATQEQAKRVNKLEKSREALHLAVSGYRALLLDKTLARNRLEADRANQMRIFSELNRTAGELEGDNLGEGLMSLAITALNSIINVKDEVNNLRYEQAMLYKKIVALEAAAIPVEPPAAPQVAATEE